MAVIALFAGYLAWHAGLAQAQVHPGDRDLPGWHELQGLSGFLKAVIFTSGLQTWPLAVVMWWRCRCLAGWRWMAAPGRSARCCGRVMR